MVAQNILPPVVWSVWVQGESNAPPLARTCWESWRRKNPGYELRILDYDSIPEEARRAADRGAKPAWVADVARINLLAHHGGIWVDTTTVCNQPLDSWLPSCLSGNFFAFSQPGPDRPISNWFLAAPKNSEVAKRLCDVVNDYCAQSSFADGRTPLERWLTRGLHNRWGHRSPNAWRMWLSRPVVRWMSATPYYWFHYLFARLLSCDGMVRDRWAATRKLSARNAIDLFNLELTRSEHQKRIPHLATLSPVYKLQSSWNWLKYRPEDYHAVHDLLEMHDLPNPFKHPALESTDQ